MSTQRIIVQSTALRWVEYDAAERRLRVQFADGSVYDYYGVGPEVYEEVTDAAGSVGRDFIRLVKRVSFRAVRVA